MLRVSGIPREPDYSCFGPVPRRVGTRDGENGAPAGAACLSREDASAGLQGGIAPHIRDIPPKFGLQGPGALALIVGLVVVYVALCWLALKLYDEPVRRFLTQWRVRVAAS